MDEQQKKELHNAYLKGRSKGFENGKRDADKLQERIKELEDMLQNLANDMMECYEMCDKPEKGALLGWHQRIDEYLKGQRGCGQEKTQKS